MVVYNLYHCRLGDIPQAVFASEYGDDDDYTDEEIERMRPRSGIERALDNEHRKALRKVGIELNKITPTKTTTPTSSSSTKTTNGAKTKRGGGGGSGSANGRR
jgi:hypothetical protein